MNLPIEHYIIELFLIGLIIFNEVRNYRERKDLTAKLMARTFQEYALFDLQKDAMRNPHKPIVEKDESFPL